MKSGEKGQNLLDMIKKAISDGEITTSEDDQILALVHKDGKIDNQEQRLLSQLQQMLADGSVKRVKG